MNLAPKKFSYRSTRNRLLLYLAAPLILVANGLSAIVAFMEANVFIGVSRSVFGIAVIFIFAYILNDSRKTKVLQLEPHMLLLDDNQIEPTRIKRIIYSPNQIYIEYMVGKRRKQQETISFFQSEREQAHHAIIQWAERNEIKVQEKEL